MSKKDYIKIALAIKEARDKSKDNEEKMLIRHIITELIKVFKNDNSLFNSERFESAIYEQIQLSVYKKKSRKKRKD